MKTYVNRINGKEYLYAYDKIFITKGRSVQKVKSLGPISAVTEASLKQKKREFIEYLLKEEANARIEYWSKRLNHDSFARYIHIDKIELARGKLYRAKEDMGNMATSAMETAFLVDFIYNSNKIEGSKVPRESVETEVKRGGPAKNNEVGNALKAVYYVDTKFTFTTPQIKKLHAILLAHEPQKLGLRKERVVVANSEVTKWDKIAKELKDLLNWYKNAKKTWYPPELAFTFYYRFERIHPFVDGNGRVGRLLMNKILKDHHYHPIIIWDKRRKAHLSAFENYVDGKGEKYFKFMIEQFVKTHEIYINKIQKAFDLEKQMKYFLEPSTYNLT